MLSEVASRDVDDQPGVRTTASAPEVGERGRQARRKEGRQEGQLPRGKSQRHWDRWRTRPSERGLCRKQVLSEQPESGLCSRALKVREREPGTTADHQQGQKATKAPRERLLLCLRLVLP